MYMYNNIFITVFNSTIDVGPACLLVCCSYGLVGLPNDSSNSTHPPTHGNCCDVIERRVLTIHMIQSCNQACGMMHVLRMSIQSCCNGRRVRVDMTFSTTHLSRLGRDVGKFRQRSTCKRHHHSVNYTSWFSQATILVHLRFYNGLQYTNSD